MLEEVRKKMNFGVIGYVVMPEHVHLLLSNPVDGTSFARVLLNLKSRTAKALLPRRKRRRDARQAELFSDPREERQFWQKRYYDFNVWSHRKLEEKLQYMHQNPVKRGLVSRPEDWRWSSYRHYALREQGMVKIGFPEIPLSHLFAARKDGAPRSD